jgi:hypothetical protein
MTVQYIDSVKYSRMEAVRAKIDTGSGTACIKVYTTPRPATGGTPTGATLLATINLGNPSGTTTAGDLALSVAAETIIAASGAPNWARVLDRDGAVVGDMSVGLPGSGADLEVGSSYLYAGGKLLPTSAYLRDG